MHSRELHVVTGAFGFTGKYITHRLLAMGKKVRTLTGHPNRPNPFGSRVEVLPFQFDRPGELVKNLQGATTLYNTYWIRFARGPATFAGAVENSRALIKAAAEAGVKRMVHISITNPSVDSPLPYFRGKALVEKAVVDSGLSYAIIRPAVIFGPEDILINNIAWLLKRFPVFGVPGAGDYRLQPVFVEDLAELAVDAGQRKENMICDAPGPEKFTFLELVQVIRDKIGSRARIIHVNPGSAYFLCKLLGRLVNDVLLTRDEIRGLMANLLVTGSPPAGQTSLADWLEQNRNTVGVKYASELNRHYR